MQRSIFVAILASLVLGAFAQPSSAADPEFVGIMALVTEEDVAEQLGLSAEEHDKLFNWVDDRELAAIDVVLSLRDEPDKQRERLKEFRAESEELGLQMLTPEQRAKLKQIYIARQGMQSLGRDDVQKKIELTDEQRAEVEKLLAAREQAVGKAPASRRGAIAADYERRLASQLSPEQRLEWDKLAGRAAPDAEIAIDDAPSEETPADAGPATDDADVPPPGENDKPPPETVAHDAGEEAAPSPEGEVKLRFNFRYAPWETVLEWFAEQAGLSLELTNTPPGTFNYTDPHAYTPSEAIDLLNSVLLTKGYTLVRHRRMLMVLNLEDGVPPNLIETVPVDELDQRGRYEIVSALFRLDKISAEDAEREVRKLLGPQGEIIALPKTQALLITETSGRLRVIRELLEDVEEPAEQEEQEINEVPLEHALAEEVLLVIRQLMGLPEDRNAAPDGSLRIATDALGTRLFVAGDEEKVQKVKDILKLVDVPSGVDGTPGVVESPQLEVYSITAADPESVLKVMQTLMAGESGVRLDIDPKTGSLVALARPSQHATIKATIDQMQRDGRMIEVIQLNVVDPQLAVLSINKLFGAAGEEGGNQRAPMVDADPVSGQLLVRGTESQIEQIRTLLRKMGEGDFDDDSAYAQAQRGNVRMVPLTGGAAREALKQMEMIWPTMRRNKIRVVTPSAAVREMRSSDLQEEASSGAAADRLQPPPDLNRLNELFRRFEIRPRQPAPSSEDRRSPAQENAPQGDAEDEEAGNQSTNKADTRSESGDQRAYRSAESAFRYAAAQTLFVQTNADDASAEQQNDEASGEPPTPTANADRAAGAEEDGQQDGDPVNRAGADIIVAPGPGGILIASEDLDALDEFEQVLQTLASRGATGREYTVFYLKYARAEVAAELLTQILGGGTGGGSANGEGPGLLGDLASAALGDTGGGLVGSLLGLGGGGGAISTSGSVTMVADQRLNALVVQANPSDLDLVEQLLQVIDQEASPEDVQTFARPRLIPVYYTSAEEIAGVVRQVYAERLAGAGGNTRRQPSPEEFIRALRGRRGGSSRSAQDEQQKMTIGVDPRSNSLVVSAPEPVFEEVRALVEQLDQAGAEETETVRVVTLKSASPELVQKAIVSITGGNVTTNTSSVGGAATNAQQPGRRDDAPDRSPEEMREQIRRRIEMFNALQRQNQRDRGRDGVQRPDADSPGENAGQRPFGNRRPRRED